MINDNDFENIDDKETTLQKLITLRKICNHPKMVFKEP